MAVYLVRHAKAGDREAWEQPDELRPLTKAGRRQADGLVGVLGDRSVERIISSPYVRCVQTVRPLARALGLPVEEDEALAEGADLGHILRLIEAAAAGNAVLCSHADVIEGTLLQVSRPSAGVETPLRLKKGSTWVLEADGGSLVVGRYLPPP